MKFGSISALRQALGLRVGCAGGGAAQRAISEEALSPPPPPRHDEEAHSTPGGTSHQGSVPATPVSSSRQARTPGTAGEDAEADGEEEWWDAHGTVPVQLLGPMHVLRSTGKRPVMARQQDGDSSSEDGEGNGRHAA